jgi:4-diphosphocytidyl-2-C-methyl-D-erythritol kinase
MPSDRPSSSLPSSSAHASALAPDQPAGGAPRVLRLLAPAKVNLHLRVGPPRADGFHPLLTWMCTASLFDTLTIEARPLGAVVGERGEASPSREPGPAGPAAPEGSITSAPRDAAAGEAGAVNLTCDLPGLPCGVDNLVVRVARAWQQRQAELRGTGASAGRGRSEAADAAAVAQNAGGHDGVDVRLDVTLGKRIPVGAGLGGGSSDAARTLLALDRLSDTRLPAEDLSAFAARFGSDLSFFVYGRSAVCRGRGEQVMPIAPPAARWAVLMLPRELSMPTPAVYRKFDELRLGHVEPLSLEPNWAAWAKLTAEQLLPRLVNDLEPAAFAIAPELGALRSDIEQALARPVRMSGSGSSLFTLFDAADDARRAAEIVAARFQQRAEAVELAANFADDLNGSAA